MSPRTAVWRNDLILILILSLLVFQKEPYHFSDLLFLSRVFLSSTDSFDEDPNAALQQAVKSSGTVGGGKKSGGGGKKKKKQQHESNSDEEKTWFYHAEDEWIQRVSPHFSNCRVRLSTY